MLSVSIRDFLRKSHLSFIEIWQSLISWGWQGVCFMRTQERNFCWATAVLLLTYKILKRLLLTVFSSSSLGTQNLICTLPLAAVVCWLYAQFDLISHLYFPLPSFQLWHKEWGYEGEKLEVKEMKPEVLVNLWRVWITRTYQYKGNDPLVNTKMTFKVFVQRESLSYERERKKNPVTISIHCVHTIWLRNRKPLHLLLVTWQWRISRNTVTGTRKSSGAWIAWYHLLSFLLWLTRDFLSHELFLSSAIKSSRSRLLWSQNIFLSQAMWVRPHREWQSWVR